jgi:putative transposase
VVIVKNERLGNMDNNPNKSSSHAVYLIRLHIIFVTKYRRKVLSKEIRDFLGETMGDILKQWKCSLIEFGGEEDHIHALIDIHPSLNISGLINNLKSATSKKTRNRFKEHISKFYWKPYLWNRAYYVGSVGSVSLETIQKYIEKQGTKEKSKPKPLVRPTS